MSIGSQEDADSRKRKAEGPPVPPDTGERVRSGGPASWPQYPKGTGPPYLFAPGPQYWQPGGVAPYTSDSNPQHRKGWGPVGTGNQFQYRKGSGPPMPPAQGGQYWAPGGVPFQPFAAGQYRDGGGARFQPEHRKGAGPPDSSRQYQTSYGQPYPPAVGGQYRPWPSGATYPQAYPPSTRSQYRPLAPGGAGGDDRKGSFRQEYDRKGSGPRVQRDSEHMVSSQTWLRGDEPERQVRHFTQEFVPGVKSKLPPLYQREDDEADECSSWEDEDGIPWHGPLDDEYENADPEELDREIKEQMIALRRTAASGLGVDYNMTYLDPAPGEFFWMYKGRLNFIGALMHGEPKNTSEGRFRALSHCWSNVKYLGCGYMPEIMDVLRRYDPDLFTTTSWDPSDERLWQWEEKKTDGTLPMYRDGVLRPRDGYKRFTIPGMEAFDYSSSDEYEYYSDYDDDNFTTTGAPLEPNVTTLGSSSSSEYYVAPTLLVLSSYVFLLFGFKRLQCAQAPAEALQEPLLSNIERASDRALSMSKGFA